MRHTYALTLLVLLVPAAVCAQGAGNAIYITSGSRTDQPAKPGQASDEAAAVSQNLQDQVAVGLQNQYPCAPTPTKDRDIVALLRWEKDHSMLDPDYEADLAGVAGALGARYLISVTAIQMGGQIIMQVVVLDTVTGKAIERFDRQTTSQNAVSDIDQLARKVADALGPLFAVTPQAGRTYPVGTVLSAVHTRTFLTHSHMKSTWTEALAWDEKRNTFEGVRQSEGDPKLRCSSNSWGDCGGCATCTCAGRCFLQFNSPGRFRLVNVTGGVEMRGVTVAEMGEVTIAGSCKK